MPIAPPVQLDPGDKKVHVRTRVDAPTSAPALCGKTGQATVSEAFGFWGPGGAGYEDMCKPCVEADLLRRPWLRP